MTNTAALLSAAITAVIPVWMIPADSSRNPARPIGHCGNGGAGPTGRWHTASGTIHVAPVNHDPIDVRITTVQRAVLAVLRAAPDIWQDCTTYRRLNAQQAALVSGYDPTQARQIISDPDRHAELGRLLHQQRSIAETGYGQRAAALILGSTPTGPTVPAAEQLSLFTQ